MNKIIQYVADNPGVCISQVTALYSYNDLDVCFKCGAIETSQGFNCDPCCLGKGHTIETATAAVEKYIKEQKAEVCDCLECLPPKRDYTLYEEIKAALIEDVTAEIIKRLILARH